MRVIFRRNFIKYILQESIYDLKGHQIAEDCIINDIEFFGQVSSFIFLIFLKIPIMDTFISSGQLPEWAPTAPHTNVHKKAPSRAIVTVFAEKNVYSLQTLENLLFIYFRIAVNYSMDGPKKRSKN